MNHTYERFQYSFSQLSDGILQSVPKAINRTGRTYSQNFVTQQTFAPYHQIFIIYMKKKCKDECKNNVNQPLIHERSFNHAYFPLKIKIVKTFLGSVELDSMGVVCVCEVVWSQCRFCVLQGWGGGGGGVGPHGGGAAPGWAARSDRGRRPETEAAHAGLGKVVTATLLP